MTNNQDDINPGLSRNELLQHIIFFIEHATYFQQYENKNKNNKKHNHTMLDES